MATLSQPVEDLEDISQGHEELAERVAALHRACDTAQQSIQLLARRLNDLHHQLDDYKQLLPNAIQKYIAQIDTLRQDVEWVRKQKQLTKELQRALNALNRVYRGVH